MKEVEGRNIRRGKKNESWGWKRIVGGDEWKRIEDYEDWKGGWRRIRIEREKEDSGKEEDKEIDEEYEGIIEKKKIKDWILRKIGRLRKKRKVLRKEIRNLKEKKGKRGGEDKIRWLMSWKRGLKKGEG